MSGGKLSRRFILMDVLVTMYYVAGKKLIGCGLPSDRTLARARHEWRKISKRCLAEIVQTHHLDRCCGNTLLLACLFETGELLQVKS